MAVICLCETARTKTSALIHFLSACLPLSFCLSSRLIFLFSPSHTVYVKVSYYSLLLVPCSPRPWSPHPCPFTLTVSPLYAYSNKGFMYCHNMINAVFAKGNYCQQKGRATHEVITTDHCMSRSSRSATRSHLDTGHREIDLKKGQWNELSCRYAFLMCLPTKKIASQVIEPYECYIQQPACNVFAK